MKSTRVIHLTSDTGYLDFQIEAGVYKVVLKCFAFLNFQGAKFMRLQIDGLELGSANHPILVNHTGYHEIYCHYTTTYLQPRNAYRVLDMNGTLSNFAANGQQLTLIFDMERIA